MPYRISCNEHDTLLRARGALDGHATVADAVAALATIYPAPVAHDCGDGLTVWPSPEAYERDGDALYAVATIYADTAD